MKRILLMKFFLVIPLINYLYSPHRKDQWLPHWSFLHFRYFSFIYNQIHLSLLKQTLFSIHVPLFLANNAKNHKIIIAMKKYFPYYQLSKIFLSHMRFQIRKKYKNYQNNSKNDQCSVPAVQL